MSKEILVVLNRKRGSVKAQLTRIKDCINNPDEKDKIKLESKMDTLKNLRIKLSDIRNEYYEVAANDSHLEPLELEILDLEDDFEDIQVRIKNIISKIDLKNNDVTSCVNGFNNIQLPRFNGSYHDWFNFKEKFISLIDSNNSLADSQKLYYLKSTFTGIAKDVITIDDSYTSLFECLKKRFENKKLILTSHFSEILSLEKFTYESAKNLRTLIDFCLKHFRGLKMVGLELNEFSEVLLINLILRKLGKETRKNYELNLASTELPKWDDFMDFSLKRCLILENIQTNNAITVPSERSNKTKSFLDKLDPVNCVICKQQPHPVFRCNKFNNLSVNERFNSVKKNNLRINCFSYSHRVALCKSPQSCPNCSKRYNSLLCRNFERRVDSQRSQISETLPTLERKNTTTLNVNSECFKPKQTIPHVESFDNEGEEFVGHAKGHSTVMLSTAIVYCQNNRWELFPLRTLLDCGSMCNLITKDMPPWLWDCNVNEKIPLFAVLTGLHKL
ncbi:DUF1758 domain-containing protein [Trichonephila clavata]|uniref:DUF1758 domain-containing protein n=1 Tax=Trichonephila clavata TaxID=2740835 RepID=A0A8X6H0H7_TRICU|nr:DUF1758 domain-containing protein [Trichonephila clavata]